MKDGNEIQEMVEVNSILVVISFSSFQEHETKNCKKLKSQLQVNYRSVGKLFTHFLTKLFFFVLWDKFGSKANGFNAAALLLSVAKRLNLS